MKYITTFFFLLLYSASLIAQQRSGAQSAEGNQPSQQDSLQKPPISAYKIISITGDTTFVDTSLTIQKEYKFNYLRRDNFELLPFSNVGQTYNKLAYNFEEQELIPQLGARARHYNFMDVQDIYYYEVPTPLTELYFKTVPEQGQSVDAFFTVNTSPRLNFSVAYKGLRSLGRYQNALTSSGNFRATLNYSTFNEKYRLKTHFVSQDLLNRENGGLNAIALQQYINLEEEFEDRSLLEVKFENAENVLFGKRFYLNQEYDLVAGEENNITLHHILDFSDKKFLFRQDLPVEFFGETLKNSNLNDEEKLRNVNNQVAVSFQNSTLGKLTGKAGHTFFNYRYNSLIFLEEQIIANNLRGHNYAAGAEYLNKFGPLTVYGDAMANLAGEFSGYYLKAGLMYRLNPLNSLRIEFNSNERAPNFNFLLHQSDYLNYNWQNDFSNQSTHVFNVNLNSPWANVELAFNQVNQYTYFSLNEEDMVKPFQHGEALSYLKFKIKREFHYGKFSLNNTLMYQNVAQGGEVFNVPDFITRNSLYYSDHLFQKALYLQTGLTLKYFTSYAMNGYDPVLAEFYVQNSTELGGYPVVEFFFNSKIRQTRIFFKLENLNSLIEGNNNFSAPDYPYRDFLLRFGLVWNFFL